MRALFSRFSTLQMLIEQVSVPGIIVCLVRLEIKPASFAHSYAPSGLYQLVVSLMSMVVLNSLDFSKENLLTVVKSRCHYRSQSHNYKGARPTA